MKIEKGDLRTLKQEWKGRPAGTKVRVLAVRDATDGEVAMVSTRLASRATHNSTFIVETEKLA